MSTNTHLNHAAPLARSNSFLGTIKAVVTAPFTWFTGSEDEFEATKGKRRRLQVIPEDALMEDGTLHTRAKKMRVSSPDRDIQPYLDPPRSAFAHSRRASDHSTSSAVRDSTRSPRKTLHLPSASNQLQRNRRTVSPLPTSSHFRPEAGTRTMSLDPPSRTTFSSRIQPTPTIQDLQSEPNHTGRTASASRDQSKSPRHLRFRSSLTPQSSVTGFGPVVPPRRERGPEEPPPLAALMSNPTFVKPPPGVQRQGAAEVQKPLTLGTLMDSQRSARPPARQSSILFGTGSMTDVSARHLWPVNKAEIALHELEVYKTPLLPTRLRGATAVPDMFLHKEKKHITLMTDDRPVKPRLGTKSKEKGKEKGKKAKERGTVNGTKPYAGEGGMKKWLARRKKEEEEEKEKERAEAMEDERVEEERSRKVAEAGKKEELKVPPPPPVPVFEPRVSREGPSPSSLRVGRTRARSHLERPVSRRAKFSAAFEDEDEDMEDSRMVERKALEEAAKKVPAFELPTNFSFARETTFTHDLTNAKEPPISSLPFSLTKPAPAPAPIAAPPAAEAAQVPPIPVPMTPAPALPKISLVPPTPETVKVAPETPSPPATAEPAPSAAPAPSGVPNFFTNSSVFAKTPVVTTAPSFLSVPVLEKMPAEGSEPKAGAAVALPQFVPPAPTAVPSESAHTPSKEAEQPTTTTLFPAPPFTFGPPAKLVESVPTSTPSAPPEQPPAAEPAKPAALANGTSFAFGASPRATTATPAGSIEPPKNVFTFGQPAPPTQSTSAPPLGAAQPAPDASKSLFGAPPPATPFSFGQRPSTAPAEEKPPATSFAFGTTSAPEKKPAPSFAFDSSTPSTPAPALAPFAFGATSSGTIAADVSTKQPFMFGPTAPARPTTPPKAEPEVTMDESPARDTALNGSSKAPERPTLNFTFATPSGSALFAQSPATTTAPFSFGGPGATINPFAKEEKKETKPTVTFGAFGQTSSTGFSFGQKPPESPATTAAPATLGQTSSTGFPFGQKPPESPATTASPAPPFQFAQPSPTVAPVSPFTFGAGPASANPFGQPSTASAPSSPSFNRPTSFSFGTPTATQPKNNPFAFGAGSQPVSPAAGSTTLPSGTTGGTSFTFGTGAGVGAQPGVGFGVGASAAAPAGSLFTMGSAAPPPEGAGGRRIKGLPRRGARR